MSRILIYITNQKATTYIGRSWSAGNGSKGARSNHWATALYCLVIVDDFTKLEDHQLPAIKHTVKSTEHMDASVDVQTRPRRVQEF